MTAKKSPPWYIEWPVMAIVIPFIPIGIVAGLIWSGLKIGWLIAESFFD